MKTPCEDKGYEVGQVFEVTEPVKNWEGLFNEGAIIVLDELRCDDSTHKFICVHGQNEKASNGGSWGYIEPRKIKRIYPPEEVSKSVEVVCEGKTTTLTREDAEKLNLC